MTKGPSVASYMPLQRTMYWTQRMQGLLDTFKTRNLSFTLGKQTMTFVSMMCSTQTQLPVVSFSTACGSIVTPLGSANTDAYLTAGCSALCSSSPL